MYFNVGKNKYWVEIFGCGDPVVLLHGFTGSTHTWYSIRDQLAEKNQVILLDLPGHGKTQARVTSIETCCNELADIFKQMNLTTIHLLGYSMGGRTALTFAILYPGFVESLILESATPGINDEFEKMKRIKSDQKLAQFLLENTLEDFINKWEKIPLFHTQQTLPESVKLKIRKERFSHSKEGLANSLQVMGTGVMPSWWESLKQLRCKVCIIVGEKDKKFVQIGQHMNQILMNNDFYVIKNSGHAIHVEQEEIFGTIVNEFISRRRNN
ncbi:2-succinyl-6-hydroxy-2,4-cyclohexadiene-1-carboxylate synthase [Gracilibacillus ureilyticus]|uniref:Putative 2-succinyl-6-hydroxy-2,4-cyclohexadiene-1-carboxylate synthase n=1 Tax=Gracilibacillus ureilyticus TaxID=531814 RepID=A0A1H9TQX6_9BACI|nr:2-succinyl-6-hydroxy-2,4-cyclohexadiene-1-carboxylate synthase [Gracilibacillus ureilyticus]SER99586.1 2-succinyl-6-hydroxy-2,4-cyclohexadiene-1-carboxylate synthase [Gracilibacillus ureilyticus]